MNMELYYQILADYYAKQGRSNEMVDATAIVRDRCYQALCNIKEILEDDTLEDPECFYKIEEIVCVLEDLGSNAGTRHDFG